MECRKVERPVTDIIKLWCEHCRIRIESHEERTEVSGKTYHPDCYSNSLLSFPDRKNRC